MPVSSIGHGFSLIPATGRNTNARLEQTESIASKNSKESPSEQRQLGEPALNENLFSENSAVSVVRSVTFEPVLSLDDATTSQRNALQLYIANQNAASELARGDAPIVVGIDTFA